MNDSSIKQILASAVTLTGSAVASSQVPIRSEAQHTLYVGFTKGTSGTGLSLTIEVSPDDLETTAANSTWYQTGTWTSGATASFTADTFVSAASVNAAYTFKVVGKKIRIKYSETGTPSPFGTITATLLSKTF